MLTTYDELYRDDASPETTSSPPAKEVRRYRQALRQGYEVVSESGLLTNNHVLQILAALETNKAGIRKLPGTALRDGNGRVI